MSTRFGMADSRCTDFTSSRIYNDNLLTKDAQLNPFGESEKYRQWLQNKDIQDVTKVYTCSVFDYKEDYAYPK